MDFSITKLKITSDNKCLLNNLNLYPNLIKLDCSENQLTKLDLSSCVNLQGLHCSKNQFATLDLSSCVNLQKLYCSKNQFATLDLSSCVNLQILSCDNNQLTTLNLSSCVNLQKLYCDNNQLTTLDLSPCVNLQKLYCDNNQFATLDLSPCVNLQILDCDNNQLTTLDLSSCVNLQQLYCSNNQLTTLDLSSCVNLQELFCYCNKLTTLPLTNFQLRNLTYIVVSNNPINYTPDQIRILRSLDLLKLDTTNTIFNDSQNIHDISISTSMLESFNNILCNKEYKRCENVIDRILEDENLNINVKNILIDYTSDKTVHSMLKVNFEQALSYIYPLHDKNTLKILENEMLDSECKCFTGRIFRLINSLNGIIFEVNIKISLNQDLNNMASQVLKLPIDNFREVFLKNVFDKYPDITEEYLETWLTNFI